ncbi:hypothetical protein M501DRAFT_1019065 [Patellaria atrata CBS 101060]|uniref:Uncharacterized protein n=1 Tax=Patellaria atrata CBS 101060 TaxID=1346257 RepID=A0A9P4VM45_9PEZI|nr:hypothetical protein M501DRAFT_1019065 [Patellaria atrata CBS 101060]
MEPSLEWQLPNTIAAPHKLPDYTLRSSSPQPTIPMTRKQLAHSPHRDLQESHLLKLPQELRDLVLEYVLSDPIATPRHQRTVFASERGDLARYNGSITSLLQFMDVPLLHTCHQIAREGLRILFQRTTIVFICGPKVQLDILRDMPDDLHHALRNMEISWSMMPRDLKYRLDDLVEEELIPLFGFVRQNMRLRNLTVSLQYLALSSGNMVKRFKSGIPPQTRYQVYLAREALKMLLRGQLETLVIRYEPFNAWAILQPKVQVLDMAAIDPRMWVLDHYEALSALQYEIRAVDEVWKDFDLTLLVEKVEIEPWHRSNMDTNIGLELVITLALGKV